MLEIASLQKTITKKNKIIFLLFNIIIYYNNVFIHNK